MNDFLTLCRQRRSVRSYLPEKPAHDDLEYICACVQMAPSAVNLAPYQFRYVDREDDLKRLATCYPREWFTTAPACFIAYRNTSQEWVRKADGKPHGDIDTAIAIEHLCLAAAERGLGTCWVCNFLPEELSRAFPSPEGMEPVALIPVGFPADAAAEKKRKGLSELFVFDTDARL